MRGIVQREDDTIVVSRPAAIAAADVDDDDDDDNDDDVEREHELDQDQDQEREGSLQDDVESDISRTVAVKIQKSRDQQREKGEKPLRPCKVGYFPNYRSRVFYRVHGESYSPDRCRKCMERRQSEI